MLRGLLCTHSCGVYSRLYSGLYCAQYCEQDFAVSFTASCRLPSVPRFPQYHSRVHARVYTTLHVTTVGSTVGHNFFCRLYCATQTPLIAPVSQRPVSHSAPVSHASVPSAPHCSVTFMTAAGSCGLHGRLKWGLYARCVYVLYCAGSTVDCTVDSIANSSVPECPSECGALPCTNGHCCGLLL